MTNDGTTAPIETNTSPPPKPNVWSTLKAASSCRVSSNCNENISLQLPLPPKVPAVPAALPKGRDLYSGYISHIDDPSSFYVHCEQFKVAESAFNAACNKGAKASAKPQKIFKDQLYLVNVTINTKNGWYRAKVVQCDDCKDAYRVQFIDYGLKETMPGHW